MKIEVNIEKRHFFVLLGVVLLVGSVLIVNAALDPTVNHETNQIDWNNPIEETVKINHNNQPIYFKEIDQSGPGNLWRIFLDNKIFRIDVSEDSSGNSFSPHVQAISIKDNGWIGIGTSNPISNLQVQGILTASNIITLNSVDNIFGGNLIVNGDFNADSNTRGACSWITLPFSTQIMCPEDKYLAGFSHGSALIQGEMYCCEL